MKKAAWNSKTDRSGVVKPTSARKIRPRFIILTLAVSVFMFFATFHAIKYFRPVPSLKQAMSTNDPAAFLRVAHNLNQNYPISEWNRLKNIATSLLEGDLKSAQVQMKVDQRSAMNGQKKVWANLLKSTQMENRWQLQEVAMDGFDSIELKSNGNRSNLTEQRLKLYSSEFRTGESFDELWKLFLDTKNPRALADWLAKPLTNEMDTRGLESDLKFAFQNDPEFPWIRRAWGLLLWSSGRYQEAVENLGAVALMFENDPQGRFALAESLMSMGQKIDPLHIMGQPPTFSGCPDTQSARYYLNLGRLYESQSDLLKAMEQYKKSIKANPAEWEAVVRYGQLQLSAGEKDVAESCRNYADRLKVQFESIRKASQSTPETVWNREKYLELEKVCESFALPSLDDSRDKDLKSLVECREFFSIYQSAAIAWRDLSENDTSGKRGQRSDKMLQFEDGSKKPAELVFLARPRLVNKFAKPLVIEMNDEFKSKSNSFPIQFERVSVPGLEYQYESHEGQKLRIADVMGGGVAMIDFDQDGWLDLYFPNGRSLDPLADQSPKVPGNNRLFRNIQGERFEDVTNTAGVAGKGYAMGASVGDYDQDGWPDLFVTGYGNAILYKNKGNGTFQDVTTQAGVDCNLWTTASAFADLDADGDLDLVAITYVDAPPDKTEGCVDQLNHPIHCSPGKFPAQPDKLWENIGGGKFREISQISGIGNAENGRGLGLAVADLDQDGKLDLFVANDASPNFYFHNEGQLKFREMAAEAGLAVDGSGKATASMGVVADDLNEDGLIDIFHTNFINEPNTFRKNLGGGLFMDATLSANLSASSLSKTGFGACSFDADHDGHVDLFVTNGHLDDQPWIQTPMAQTPLFYQGLGKGKFQMIPETAVPYLSTPTVGRGMAMGDLNNDGYVDMVIVERDRPVTILMNRSISNHRWVGLELRDKTGHPPVGAKVTLKSGTKMQVKWIVAGTSYLASQDNRLIFGLGDSQEMVTVEVEWPSRIGDPSKTIQDIRGLEPGKYTLIKE